MNDRTSAIAPDTVSMYEHEEEMFRMERHNKRLFLMLTIVILLLFATNTGWLIYEGLYDTVSYSQDGEGINNINTGRQGDLLNGADGQNKDPQGSQGKGCEDS